MNLTVTDAALRKVMAILESEGRAGQGLRVAVSGGGCSGVQYSLNFVDNGGEPDDVIVDAGSDDPGRLKIYLDPASAGFLEGGSIDYLETLGGAGFKVDSPRSAGAKDPPKPTGPQAVKVQEILDTVVNPGVASHGGWVGLVDVKDNVVFLRLGGGCQGCGMVDVTLKQGIEGIIKERMPEIISVYDVTDHAGGENPYYQPAKH